MTGLRAAVFALVAIAMTGEPAALAHSDKPTLASIPNTSATKKNSELTIVVDDVIKSRLKAIDELIAKKDFNVAVRIALNAFNIESEVCRSVEVRPIEGRNAVGDSIIAQTRLDQTLVVNPREIAFKNSRFLVSVLAHEVTHCAQNQKMYRMAVNSDPELAALQEKVPSLKTLADLEDLATVATKDSPARAEAEKKFKALSARVAGGLSADKILAASHRVMEDIQVYEKSLGELHEMEASLRAFEVPGVLTSPKANEKPSEEFAFQYRYLMVSTNHFLKTRALFGARGDNACKVANFVPFEMTLQHERTCTEAVRLIETYISKIQS
jgi:hypothetical protein